MTSFTSNFDQRIAGLSPGRVDAPGWALQPMRGWGIFDYTRQQAMGLSIDQSIRRPAPDTQEYIDFCRGRGTASQAGEPTVSTSRWPSLAQSGARGPR
jgi:hypothetical protein